MHDLALSSTYHTLWVAAIIAGFVVVLAVAAGVGALTGRSRAADVRARS